MVHPNGLTPEDTETQRVYRALKREILARSFRPGEALNEARLSAQFGTSRTPLREALVRLEADGLLTILPRRGSFVRQLSLRDFLEANELRLLLEPYAARRAASLIDDDVLTDLRSEQQAINVEQPRADDYQALQHLDRRMHRSIAEAAQNARLAQYIQNLNDMMQVVRETDMRRRHRAMHESIGAILGALEARDADESEALMRQHISDFSGALVDLV